MIRIIGDIHGNFAEYAKIKDGCEKTLQVGDFGFSFGNVEEGNIQQGDRFILGNHDNPFTGREHPNHIESGDECYGFFAVNGAWSKDRIHRIEGVDWWKEEEHTFEEFYKIMDMWEASSAEMIISHNCPQDVYPYIGSHHLYENPTRTAQMLSSMVYIRKPKLFVFGHHHISFDMVLDETRYICIPEYGYIDIEE